MRKTFFERLVPKALWIVMLLTAVLLKPCSLKGQSQSEPSLKVSLPSGWEMSTPAPGSLHGQAFRYKGDPAFEVSLLQNVNNPGSTAMGLPFECDFFFGAMLGINQGNVAILKSRPNYFPEEYYARVLLPKNQEQVMLVACLFLGRSNVGVMLRPVPTSAEESKIAPVLQAIVNAAKTHSTLVYAPGKVNLSKMKVTASLSNGTWAVGKVKNPLYGETDLLVRTGGTAEMKIVPYLDRGNCSGEMKGISQLPSTANPPVTTKMRTNPPYLSRNWEPTAMESVRTTDQINKLAVIVCRQLTPSAALLAMISYGDEVISESDALSIAKLLDEIAVAVQRGPKGDGTIYFPSPLSSSVSPVEVGLQINI